MLFLNTNPEENDSFRFDPESVTEAMVRKLSDKITKAAQTPPSQPDAIEVIGLIHYIRYDIHPIIRKQMFDQGVWKKTLELASENCLHVLYPYSG
jgi:hypothetical protein